MLFGNLKTSATDLNMLFEVEGVHDVARNTFVARTAYGNEIFLISVGTLFLSITTPVFHY